VIDEHYTHLDEDEFLELFRQEVTSKVDDLLADYLVQWRRTGENIITLQTSA